MKITHIITRLILGGAQENTLLTCREQARLGHEVVLLTGPPLGPEGSLLEAARREPFRTVLVPSLRRAVRPWTDLVAYNDLLKNLREERPDVVHTHSSKAGILGRRAARAAGVRCIVHTIHGLAFDAWQGGLANWAYRTAERRASRWSHRLIAVCADMADRAAEAGLMPRDRIAVVYSGIDPAPFRAAAGRREEIRRRWNVGSGDSGAPEVSGTQQSTVIPSERSESRNLAGVAGMSPVARRDPSASLGVTAKKSMPETSGEADDFIFLKIARLFHLKGHEFVLPAFAAVARRHPGVRLVLAGDGILRLPLEAEARRLGIADRVTFLGLVPPEEIPGLLWASDAVVHAGLREGLARVLPQAGLCGRPVISYDIGGAREVVRDGENGFLLPAPAPGESPEASVSCLAEAMQRLAADPAAARAMGGRWPEEVLRPFDYHDGTARIMRVYEDVLRD
jgi:glycosyltransferase involved in cell wall biosynthesis